MDVPEPELQIDFAAALTEIRRQYLQEALGETIAALKVPEIDKELADHVPAHSLTALAAHGLRGEMIFPVPLVLATNPRLLAYYRLLYGFSQKEFYTAKTGLGRFRCMEERGVLSAHIAGDLPALCTALCGAGALLLAGIGANKVGAALLDDLTLLTLGPQLRGGANVRRGTAGIRTVFNSINEIVQQSVVSLDTVRVRLGPNRMGTVMARRRRKHFGDNHRVRHDHRFAGQFVAAIDAGPAHKPYNGRSGPQRRR